MTSSEDARTFRFDLVISDDETGEPIHRDVFYRITSINARSSLTGKFRDFTGAPYGGQTTRITYTFHAKRPPIEEGDTND